MKGFYLFLNSNLYQNDNISDENTHIDFFTSTYSHSYWFFLYLIHTAVVLARALDQIVGAAMQIQATSKKNKKQKTMPTIHNRYEFIKQAPKINCFPLQDCRSDPAEDQSRMRADVNLLHKTLTSKWNPEPISFQQSVTTPSTYHVTRHFSWKDTSVCVSVLLFVFFFAPSPLNVSQIMSSKDARTQSDSFISDVVSRFWDTSCRFMTPAWHLALKQGKNDFMDTVEYKTVRQPDIHQGLYVRKGDDWK